MIGSNGDRPYAHRQTHEDCATEKNSPLEYNLFDTRNETQERVPL